MKTYANEIAKLKQEAAAQMKMAQKSTTPKDKKAAFQKADLLITQAENLQTLAVMESQQECKDRIKQTMQQAPKKYQTQITNLAKRVRVISGKIDQLALAFNKEKNGKKRNL